MVETLLASIELQDLKKTLVESPPPLPPPPDQIMSKSKTSKLSIQPENKLSKIIPLSPSDPSKVAQVGNNLDPK
jgi:hypothetical protein